MITVRVKAEKQEKIVEVLSSKKDPLTIKQITNLTDMTYHQVASALSALCNQGMVRRIGTGIYCLAAGASVFNMSVEDQMRMKDIAIKELQNQVFQLTLRIAEILARNSL